MMMDVLDPPELDAINIDLNSAETSGVVWNNLDIPSGNYCSHQVSLICAIPFVHSLYEA